MNGSFVFVSGEANFIRKVRNRILTEKERFNDSLEEEKTESEDLRRSLRIL